MKIFLKKRAAFGKDMDRSLVARFFMTHGVYISPWEESGDGAFSVTESGVLLLEIVFWKIYHRCKSVHCSLVHFGGEIRKMFNLDSERSVR